MKPSIFLATMLCLSGCEALPRDPHGTADRIEQTGTFAIGFVDNASQSDPTVRRLIARIEHETGATARRIGGTGEQILDALDAGEIDIAVGAFRSDSPWAADIAFGPALVRRGQSDRQIEIKAAMRNGENRWIMMVERASRAVSATARSS